MGSSFFGLEILRSSLQAQRLGLDVTAHNIANANTPGYSRQVVQMRAATPFPAPGMSAGRVGQLGSGVEVAEVQRMRNKFIETQIQKETQTLGYWETKQRNVWQIELIFNEPSDTGLSNSISRYWEAWQRLAGEAEDMGHRAPVAQSAAELSFAFQQTRNQLTALQKDIDQSVAIEAQKLNRLAEELARINRQIARVDTTGQAPNDLLDRQDQILREMAQIANITVLEGRQKTVTVQISGSTLVEHDLVNKIDIIEPTSPGDLTKLVWSKGQAPVRITNGSIAALLETRDEILVSVIGDLDKLARTIIDETNKLHRSGYGLNSSTGLNFFEGTDAMTIKVMDNIMADPSNIAASVDPASPGNGDNALAIANVFTSPILEGNTVTLNGFYDGMISRLGVMGLEATRNVENQSSLVQHLYGEQDQYSAVSLDEEMANMIKYQHAYSAAARMISTIDEALEIIISRMGVVGR
ncbi:MAG TPA: flagellar hook-associated protein FlgK [Bacillota bacterium]|nr:flagellar hook-associated protein FlgK [Bacillota bacterium]